MKKTDRGKICAYALVNKGVGEHEPGYLLGVFVQWSLFAGKGEECISWANRDALWMKNPHIVIVPCDADNSSFKLVRDAQKRVYALREAHKSV